MVTDLPSPDKTSPTIKQHKTANTLILLKSEDVIVKSSWLLFITDPTPSKVTLCKLKSCSCLKCKSQLSGE